MINRRTIFTAAASLVVMSATAQINSPSADGYLSRGIEMYRDANFNGCIDQMLLLRQLHPSTREAEDALYYVAMATLGLGDDEALPLLQSFLARNPMSVHVPEVKVAIGDFYFTRAAYASAISSYLQVDESLLEPSLAEDYTYRLAYSYMMLAEFAKAEELFNSLKTAPAYANAARFYEAYIAYYTQDYRRALQLFKNVDTSTEPGNTADYYLAQLYYGNGDYSQALAAARRMIASNPVPQLTAETRRIAGESLFQLGNISDAVPFLWQYVAEAAEPQPSAYYILGMEEFNNKDYKAATKLFQQAVKSNDAMAQNAYLYLGQCYLKNGNLDNALMAFENAYRMNYDPKVQETAFYNYAVARSEGGKAPFSSSVSVFEDFLNQYPASRYAKPIEEYLITGYMTDDDYESALSSINRISQPSPEILAAKQRVLFVLGTRDLANGNTSLALNRLEDARKIEGANADIANQALLWCGDCYFKLENWDKAAACYLDFLENAAPNDANRQLAYYDLGYTRYNQHRYQEALTDFSRACDTRGSLSKLALADAHDRMGDCYFAQNRFGEAADQYKKAYDLNPSSGDYALYQLAMMKGYLGDNKQKIDLLTNLTDKFPSSGLTPAALLAQAETYTATGNSAKAIATYNRLVRDFPQSSYGRNGLLQLAITYLSNGNRRQAIDTYRKVIYTYPTSDEARLATDDLKRIYAEDGKLNEFLSFMNSVPNAPQVDPSELDKLAFDVAEDWYFDDKGTSKLEEYIRDYPNGTYIAQALYYMAENAEDEGDYDVAYDYTTRIILTYPDSDVAEQALAIKADCELQQGKGEIALASYRMLEEKASTPAMLHEARMQVMRVARDLGRYTEVINTAEKLLNSSAAGSDDLDEIHFTHAFALNQTGRHDEAQKEWSELAKSPNEIFGAKSAFYLAQSEFDRGQTEKALKSITRFLDSDSSQDYWRARGVILLSDILRKQGNTFEADQYLRALRTNYTDPGTQAEILEMVAARLK